MSIYRDIDDVVEAVRNAKSRGKRCVLLLGAGCSISGGVPLASGFVKIIKSEWPAAYKRAEAKAAALPSYTRCMAELSHAERRDLITRYIESAKINWAHVAVAQLMKTGFVDRIFTTNFDPLVLRACAMLNVFPAVYDLAASQKFKPAYVPDKAVFYFHGQHTGFVLLNTKEEVERLSVSIAPVFEDAGRRRLWIICGYGGEQDPVFEHLVNLQSFDERLYWIGHKDREPVRMVEGRLLGEAKSAFYVKGVRRRRLLRNLSSAFGMLPTSFYRSAFQSLARNVGHSH
jgi:hypothetical protein